MRFGEVEDQLPTKTTEPALHFPLAEISNASLLEGYILGLAALLYHPRYINIDATF